MRGIISSHLRHARIIRPPTGALATGATVDQENDNGETPLEMANDGRMTEIVSELIGAGADIGVACDECGKPIRGPDSFYTDIEGDLDYHEHCYHKLSHQEQVSLELTTAQARWQSLRRNRGYEDDDDEEDDEEDSNEVDEEDSYEHDDEQESD